MKDSKSKILVVDDDHNLNTVLVDKLNNHGYEAISAKDGEEGLEKAIKEHPDVILLDVVMPKMDGWMVLEKLRFDKWGKEARVIMLTALDNPEFISKAVEYNTYGYLIKTDFSLDRVVDTVRDALNK